jgi:hypothetical protein
MQKGSQGRSLGLCERVRYRLSSIAKVQPSRQYQARGPAGHPVRPLVALWHYEGSKPKYTKPARECARSTPPSRGGEVGAVDRTEQLKQLALSAPEGILLEPHPRGTDRVTGIACLVALWNPKDP